MKKPLSHVVDEKAVEIFKATLPKDTWTVYDIRPDYGKDQKVELVEGEEHTGETFWAQIKGQKKVGKLKDGMISFKLETEQLKYHAKLTAPLFLVVVDVATGVGYWVFTQKYVRTALRNVNWQDQTYINIRLPRANVLTDLSRLREAVKDAIKYMTDIAFHTDIRTEKRMLEERDSRFRVDITANSLGRHYYLSSDEIVPVEFSYRNVNARSGKIEEMLDRGVPIKFRSDEIEIKGSPLFEWFMKLAEGHDIRLQANRVLNGHVNLLRTDKSGSVIGRIDAIPAVITCGRKEARIEAKLPSNLLVINLAASFMQGETRPVSMPVDLSRWAGHRILDLPLFDAMASLFSGYQEGETLSLECFVPGQKWFSGPLRFGEGEPYRRIAFLINLLRKARCLATQKQINPVLPDEFATHDHVVEIHELYDILLGEGYKQSAPQARVSLTLSRAELRKLLNDLVDSSTLGTLNLFGDGGFPFLGETIIINPLERVVTNVRLSETFQALRNELRRSPRKGKFVLHYLATDTTDVVLRPKIEKVEHPTETLEFEKAG